MVKVHGDFTGRMSTRSGSREKSQGQPSLPKTYTVAIEQSINKALKQVDFKS